MATNPAAGIVKRSTRYRTSVAMIVLGQLLKYDIKVELSGRFEHVGTNTSMQEAMPAEVPRPNQTDGTTLQYARPERRNGENKPFVSCLAQPTMNLKGS